MKKFSSTMRANYRRTSPNKKFITVLAVAAILIVVFFVLPRLLLFATMMVTMPINAVQSWVSESGASLPQYLRNRSELVQEINDLKQTVAERGGDRFTLRALDEENKTLRNLMSDDSQERILAGVIARPNVLPYDVIFIDQGSEAGVQEGAPVYAGEQTVIGFVHNVQQYSATVTLITTPGYESTVYVLGPDIFTRAIGIGGGQIRVGVPQGVEMTIGDLVVLPAVTSGVYGEIVHIESSPTQPEQFGYVVPKIPLASLRLVSVGKTLLTGTSFEKAKENVQAVKNDLFTIPVPETLLITATTTASTTLATTTQAAVVVEEVESN